MYGKGGSRKGRVAVQICRSFPSFLFFCTWANWGDKGQFCYLNLYNPLYYFLKDFCLLLARF